jgi:glycosyltransferase 28 domain protein
VRGKIADIGVPAKLKDINSIENALRELLNRKEWNNLKKVSEKYREYNPSEVLKSEIDRLMREKVNR